MKKHKIVFYIATLQTESKQLSDSVIEQVKMGSAESVPSTVTVVTKTLKQKDTTLIWAAWKGFDEVVDLTIEGGADVDAVDEKGETALCWAVRNQHSTVAGKLVKAGANVNVKDASGNPVLIVATDNKDHTIVKMLLDSGAHVDACDKTGQTALRKAVERWDQICMDLLLDAGADPSLKDNGGTSVLDWVERNWCYRGAPSVRAKLRARVSTPGATVANADRMQDE